MATLREWREAKGWSLEELAEHMGGDIDPSMISKWERGVVMPKLPYAKRIMAVTGNKVSLDDLIRTAEHT
jgi:transcriptional regulator with XRE-family HTH domain